MEEDIWRRTKSDASTFMQSTDWVRWIHEGTGFATTQEEKDRRIVWESLVHKKHCAECMNMSGCCFPRGNMPEYPLHPKCHCKIEPIDGINAKAESRRDKFESRVFDPSKPNGKKDLFTEWGYDIMDADWLIDEYLPGKRKV